MLWATSPLPGQIEDEADDTEARSGVSSPVVRPGSAAAITGPTPGVSPIQTSEQNIPSSAGSSHIAISSTPHPGTLDGGLLNATDTLGLATTSGHMDSISLAEKPSSGSNKYDNEVIKLDVHVNNSGQSEALKSIC